MRIGFGEIIPGLKIYGKEAPYPVLNERDVRASSGIMLAVAGMSFASALLANNYIFLKLFVIVFAIEFFIRIVINPNYAPAYALGKLFVSNQIPEWSGAIQKRFAWSLGFVLAISMIFIVWVFQIRGTLPFSLCLVCLTLLWLETALGICVGCKIYGLLIDAKIIKPKVRAACPGGVCEIKVK